MFLEPKQQYIAMFNSIRYMDGINPNCSTCDCVIIPLLHYMIDMILKSKPTNFDRVGEDWEVPLLNTDGTINAVKYWETVREHVKY